MTMKKIKNATLKVAKIVGGAIATATFFELGVHGGRMLESDIDYTAKIIDSKINPIETRKRHWYSKPEAFNTRTKKFVSDKKSK